MDTLGHCTMAFYEIVNLDMSRSLQEPLFLDESLWILISAGPSGAVDGGPLCRMSILRNDNAPWPCQ